MKARTTKKREIIILKFWLKRNNNRQTKRIFKFISFVVSRSVFQTIDIIHAAMDRFFSKDSLIISTTNHCISNFRLHEKKDERQRNGNAVWHNNFYHVRTWYAEWNTCTSKLPMQFDTRQQKTIFAIFARLLSSSFLFRFGKPKLK